MNKDELEVHHFEKLMKMPKWKNGEDSSCSSNPHLHISVSFHVNKMEMIWTDFLQSGYYIWDLRRRI